MLRLFIFLSNERFISFTYLYIIMLTFTLYLCFKKVYFYISLYLLQKLGKEVTADGLVAEFLGVSYEDKIGKNSDSYARGALDIDTEMEVQINREIDRYYIDRQRYQIDRQRSQIDRNSDSYARGALDIDTEMEVKIDR